MYEFIFTIHFIDTWWSKVLCISIQITSSWKRKYGRVDCVSFCSLLYLFCK